MIVLWESGMSALRAVWAHKLRSGLTILGVVIGVLTITGLLSVALGVRRQVTNEIEALGSTTIAVLPGRVRTDEGGFNPAASIGASTLTEKDFADVQREIPEATHVAMAMLVSGTVRAGAHESPATLIFAATPAMIEALNMELASGRPLTDEDLSTEGRVVVLGSEPAAALFPDTDPVGHAVEMRGERFSVVGVLKERGTATSLFGPSFNDVMLLPISTGWRMTGTRQVFRIMLQAPDSLSVDPVKEKVAEILRRNHGMEEDFSVLTQEEILGVVGNILELLTRMTGAIAAISLVVGGINIMNIMLVAVAERTKEIGIRKAVGATRAHILAQFLIEALVLSLLGGVVGVAFARIGVGVASRYAPIPLHLPLSVIAFSLGFSAGIGLVFGVAPALRAARKDPIEALRSE